MFNIPCSSLQRGALLVLDSFVIEQRDRNVEIVELALHVRRRGIGLVFDVSGMHRPAVRQKQAKQLLVVPGYRVEGSRPLEVAGEVGDTLRMAERADSRE